MVRHRRGEPTDAAALGWVYDRIDGLPSGFRFLTGGTIFDAPVATT